MVKTFPIILFMQPQILCAVFCYIHANIINRKFFYNLKRFLLTQCAADTDVPQIYYTADGTHVLNA